MKKIIVLVLCVAVLFCSITCMSAIEVEAAKKFGTHKFVKYDANGTYMFANTVSANYEYEKGIKVRCVKDSGIYIGPVGLSYNLYFEDCPTKWKKDIADYEANARVYINNRLSYSVFNNLYCDTSGTISHASDAFAILGGGK